MRRNGDTGTIIDYDNFIIDNRYVDSISVAGGVFIGRIVYDLEYRMIRI